MALESDQSRIRVKSGPGNTIEAAIDQLPGLQLSRLAVLGLSITYFFSIYENGVFAIAIPAMMRDLGLAASDMSWPVAANLIGFAIGAYVIGYLADVRGRQMGLALTFSILALGGIASAFAWDSFSLSASRFLAGGGMGAVIAILTSYVGEVSSKTNRGRNLAAISLISSVAVVVASFAVLPLLSDAIPGGWRVVLGIGGIGLLTLPLVNRRDIVESPR